MFVNLSPETVSQWGSCFKNGLVRIIDSYIMLIVQTNFSIFFFQEDEDPRRMSRPIEYLRSLVVHKTSTNTFLETCAWTLIQKLNNFEWRIPKVWVSITDYARNFLDHPYKAIRERIATQVITC